MKNTPPNKAKTKGPGSVNNGAPQHPPFQEFPVKSLEELVSQLEKSKPEGSLVEVTPIDEMHHSPCTQEMNTIVIHGDETGRILRPDQLMAVYQYCAECRTAVRII